MTLLDLQRRTFEAIRRPLTSDYRMRARTPDARSTHEEVAAFIKPNDRLTSFERLEIYNRQYWFRLIGALTEDFPGLAALLGERRFERLAIEYLTAHPSRSFTLRNLGQSLPTWLVSYCRPLSVPHDLLLDVARLEWAHIEAFDNVHRRPLSLEKVATLTEDSRLELQPHVRLLTLSYPVDNFVVVIHHAEAEPSMASNAVSRPRRVQRKKHIERLKPEPICLAVHRFDEFVYYKRLERDAYRVLSLLADGRTISEALEGALEQSEDKEFAQKIPSWFHNWAELGWIAEACPARE